MASNGDRIATGKRGSKWLRITLSQQAKKHEGEIRILQNDLGVLDEYAINLEEIKIPSLSRNLEEQKQKVKNLELKAQKQAVNHEIEILASKRDIEVLKEYIENPQQTKHKDGIEEERLKNKQMNEEHMEQIAQYEEEFDILCRREELQNKYILNLESAVFKMKGDVKRFRILSLFLIVTKKVSFVEEVHFFVFNSQLRTNTIRRLQQPSEVTRIGLGVSNHGDSYYKLLKESVVPSITVCSRCERNFLT
ncbi:hypothetical protein RUND412_004750 [Rhizina undulata]